MGILLEQYMLVQVEIMLYLMHDILSPTMDLQHIKFTGCQL